jgi:hypothetical protein
MLVSAGILRQTSGEKPRVGLGDRTGGEQEKSRAALGRGISEGVRLNNNQIVLPRRARAHTPFGVFLSSPNGRFLRGGSVL